MRCYNECARVQLQVHSTPLLCSEYSCWYEEQAEFICIYIVLLFIKKRNFFSKSAISLAIGDCICFRSGFIDVCWCNNTIYYFIDKIEGGIIRGAKNKDLRLKTERNQKWRVRCPVSDVGRVWFATLTSCHIVDLVGTFSLGSFHLNIANWT